MLRLLLFVEPKPLPDQLFRNLYWLDFPTRLFKRLQVDAADEFEFHAAVPKRYLNRLRGNSLFGKNLYTINEAEMVQRIHAHGQSLRDVWASDFNNETDPQLSQSLDKVVCNSIPDIDWDIVFTFGEECRYSFAKQAMKLNVETAPFSRAPFKHSFFLDHCGLFRNSAPAKFFGTPSRSNRSDQPAKKSLVSTELVESGQRQDIVPQSSDLPMPGALVTEIKTSAWEAIRKNQSLEFKKEFDHYLLLPLQASNYSSFDAQCKYSSQVDYMMDVCGQVGHETGLIVTEHPNISSIDVSNRFDLVVSGLREIFPNVVYLPRAKFFSSASFDLLNVVNGVWSVASNIGPVASFFGKCVGAPADSHIAFAADANTISETLQKMSGERSDVIKPVFDWLFNHYILPSHKIDDPGWLAKYLLDRFQAFQAHGTEFQSFNATQLDCEEFVESTFDTSTKSIHYRGLIENKIELYRIQTRNRLQNLVPTDGKRSFVLLNDTAELETYRHIGCNHVVSSIYSNMEGFRLDYRVNSPADVKDDQPIPEWVIINGEGTFHHESERASQLLKIGLSYKKAGAKVALVNSIWESNRLETAKPLNDFDVVAVRDGNSQIELEKAGIKAYLTSDFSLDQWSPLDSETRQNRSGTMFTDNILFDRALKMFDAATHFGAGFWILDHRQVGRYDREGCFAAAPKTRLSPDVLTNDGQIDRARMVVAGRFHVAMACVAMGNAFVYVESNTKKMTHLCQDIGLPCDLLNVTDFIDACDWRALDDRLRHVATDFHHYLPAIRNYRQRSLLAQAKVFSLIAK